MIVAIIALVVATTGGAISAGKLLTGANIANNSLTGLDIKNGSVASIDVKNNSLVAADVKDGTLGTNDLSPVAVAGLKGAETAGFHFDSGFSSLPWSNGEVVVGVLDLPAGNYVLFAKVQANNEAPLTSTVFVLCSMTLGGAPVDTSFARGLAEGDRETFVLSGRGSLAAPGAASISCSSGPTGSFGDRHIEAIRVGSLP